MTQTRKRHMGRHRNVTLKRRHQKGGNTSSAQSLFSSGAEEKSASLDTEDKTTFLGTVSDLVASSLPAQDSAPVAEVEPEGEPEGEPEAEPEGEPEAEPEDEPEAEPEDEITLLGTVSDFVASSLPAQDSAPVEEPEGEPEAEPEVEEEPEPMQESASASAETIENLRNDYEFDQDDICLTSELSSKKGSTPVYKLGVQNGNFTKSFNANEIVMAVLYIFPNPLTTGLVLSDDSMQLSNHHVTQAGYNSRLRSRKMWVPFPGTPGVHIRITCGVIETVKPVSEGDKVSLRDMVGISIYSGQLGNLERHYSIDELHRAEDTVIEASPLLTEAI